MAVTDFQRKLIDKSDNFSRFSCKICFFVDFTDMAVVLREIITDFIGVGNAPGPVGPACGGIAGKL